MIDNLIDGVKILIQHIQNNDKIFIQVDSDVDGYTSASLLINYLHLLFPAFVENNISYRLHNNKSHGVVIDTIPKGTKLVVIPDAGSNQYEEHKMLAAAGIDVLVIDHHEAEMTSPYACVINNQLCDYPTKSLSGVGMVYKFCSYIDKVLNINLADNFLDLVALGLISDVMDLRYFETKRLIDKGLDCINSLFFNTMIEKQAYSLKNELTPFGVAFYITPYINATIRVGSDAEKLLLFEAFLDYKASELIPSTKRGCKGELERRVDQAVRNCVNLKNQQTRIRDTEVEKIEKIIEKEKLLDNKVLVVQLPIEVAANKSLTGLIANQLMSKYQRPVFVLNEKRTEVINEETKKSEEIITWEGSSRNFVKPNFDDLRHFVNESRLSLYAEGHSNAFGTGFNNDKIKDFITYSNQKLKDFDFTPVYLVDFIFHNDSFRQEDIIEIGQLKSLWGQGIEEPKIALEYIKITKDNITLMSPDRNPTIKITLPNGTSIIKFKATMEEYANLNPSEGYILLNVVGKCEVNEWMGRCSGQILVEDYEIVSRSKFYF